MQRLHWQRFSLLAALFLSTYSFAGRPLSPEASPTPIEQLRSHIQKRGQFYATRTKAPSKELHVLETYEVVSVRERKLSVTKILQYEDPSTGRRTKDNPSAVTAFSFDLLDVTKTSLEVGAAAISTVLPGETYTPGHWKNYSLVVHLANPLTIETVIKGGIFTTRETTSRILFGFASRQDMKVAQKLMKAAIKSIPPEPAIPLDLQAVLRDMRTLHPCKEFLGFIATEDFVPSIWRMLKDSERYTMPDELVAVFEAVLEAQGSPIAGSLDSLTASVRFFSFRPDRLQTTLRTLSSGTDAKISALPAEDLLGALVYVHEFRKAKGSDVTQALGAGWMGPKPTTGFCGLVYGIAF
jgi:hypothetical protein